MVPTAEDRKKLIAYALTTACLTPPSAAQTTPHSHSESELWRVWPGMCAPSARRLEKSITKIAPHTVNAMYTLILALVRTLCELGLHRVGDADLEGRKWAQL